MGAIGRPTIKADFFSVKGILETCFRTLAAPDAIEYEPVTGAAAPYLHPGRAAEIRLGDHIFGVIGELHPGEALRLELQESCVLFELDLRHLATYCSTTRHVTQAPPRFPVVRRDLALVLDRDVPADKVLKTVAGLGSLLLESVELFDVYEGGSVPEGKKSVALACRYRGKDRTLTDEEVNRAHAMLVEQAKARLNAELRQ
jgi:phenylalanyl-tRNA synthetase beta chain